uniref:C3H1-type domain-containing protein n=1 Tax=Macrostomum lignano TaxID=282301 RepID=A0A1I8IF04_9PLAT
QNLGSEMLLCLCRMLFRYLLIPILSGWMGSQTGESVPALEPADSDNELEFLAEYRPPPPPASQPYNSSVNRHEARSDSATSSSSIPEVNVAAEFSKQQQRRPDQSGDLASSRAGQEDDAKDSRHEAAKSASQDLVEHYGGCGDSSDDDSVEDSVIDDPLSDWSDSELSKVRVTTESGTGGVRVATGVAVPAPNGRHKQASVSREDNTAEELKLQQQKKDKDEAYKKQIQAKEKEKQRLEQQRLEKERQEKERQRLEKEKQEKAKRLEMERQEKQRLEKQKQEKERQEERQRQEKERQKQEKQKQEEKQRLERERQAKENEKKAAAAAAKENQKQQQQQADQSGNKKKKKSSKQKSSDSSEQNAVTKQSEKANIAKQATAAEKESVKLKDTRIHEQETEQFRQALAETSWQTVPAGGKKSGGGGVGSAGQSSSAEPLKLIKDGDFPFLAKWDLCLACSDCSKPADGRVYDYEIATKPQKHNCPRNQLFAKEPGETLWKLIRPRVARPGYTGNYYRCYKSKGGYPCRENCTFGHSEIETELWNFDKNYMDAFTVAGFIAKHNGETPKQQRKPAEPAPVKPLMTAEIPPKVVQQQPHLPPIGALFSWTANQVTRSPVDAPPTSQSAAELHPPPPPPPPPPITQQYAKASKSNSSNSAQFSASVSANAPAYASGSMSSSAPIAASASVSATSSSYYSCQQQDNSAAELSKFAFDLACANCVDDNGNRADAPCETCSRDCLIARLLKETTWYVVRMPKEVDLGYSYVYELCSNQATFGECFHGDECEDPHSDVECELWNLQARGSLTIQYIVDQLKVNTAAASPQKKPPPAQAAAARISNFGLGDSSAQPASSFGGSSGLYGYSDTASYDAMYSVAKDSEDYGNEAEADADQLEFPLDSTHQYRLGCLDCVAELLGQNGFAYCMLDNHSSGHACQLDCLFVCQREKASEGWKLIRPPPDYFRQEFTNFCRHFARKQRCQLGLDCPFPHGHEELHLWNLQCDDQFNVARFIEQARQSLQPAVALIPPGDEAEEQQQVYYGGYDPGLPAARPASLLSPDHSQPMVGRGGGDYLNSLDDFNDEPPQPQTASLYSAAAAASASASQSPVSSHTGLRPGFAAALPAAAQQQQQQGAKKSQSYLNSLDNFDEPAPLLRPIGQKFAPPASAASIISPLMEVKTSASGGFPINAAFPTSRTAGQAAASTPEFPSVPDYSMVLACDQCSTPLDVICTRFKYDPATGHSCAETRLLVRAPGASHWCQVRQLRSGSKPVREYYNCRLYVEDKCLRSDCDYAHGEVECQLWNLERVGRWSWDAAVRRLRKSTAAASAVPASSNSAAAAASSTGTVGSSGAQSAAAAASAPSAANPQPQQQLLKAVCFKCRSPRDPNKPSQCQQRQHAWVKPIIVYSNSGLDARAPVPNPNRPQTKFFLCQNIAKTKQCRYGVKCIFPHSPDEERLWNLMSQAKETDLEKYYEKYCAPSRRN